MTRRTPLLLALAALALAACGGGGDDAPAGGRAAASGPADAQEVTVVGTPGLAFAPNQLTAVPGTLTLSLEVEDGPPHNLVFGDTSLAKIGSVSAGQRKTASYTFTGAGTYDFVCTFHPGMEGRLVVG